MLVPRSFRYSASPEKERTMFDEKRATWKAGREQRRPSVKSRSPGRTPTESVATTVSPPATKPVAVPAPTTPQPERHYRQAEEQAFAPAQNRMPGPRRKRMPASHDPNSLPPSVAALLAVTQIPRPKPHQVRRKKPTRTRQMSIDELVSEWKNDIPLSPSYGSSPALSMLLEEADETAQNLQSQSLPEGHDYLHCRSTSEESIPSLENDDKSLLSFPSPPTPEYRSLRNAKSVSNFQTSGGGKREKSRSLPAAQECGTDHPLIPSLSSDDEPDDSFLISPPQTSTPNKGTNKGRFTSNLTLSLQALKNAALTKLSSFKPTPTNPTQQPPQQRSPFPDDVLWSHPFLFPRFSPEVRPPPSSSSTAYTTPPSEAERRYLNPLPLTFEEQEAPFQRALHAPYLAEEIAEAPTIQMQTYNRARRKGSVKKTGGGGVDPNSEAGRAAAGGVRVREPRENADFLRVVVLEMNMRRSGKLESGTRARMWLPPRQAGERKEGGGGCGVPERWRGMSV